MRKHRKKRRVLPWLIAAALAGGALFFRPWMSVYHNHGKTDAPGEWRLVWSDEFDGDALDLTKWRYDVGFGKWGNEESEYYTKGDNLTVADGVLTITARCEQRGKGSYTSGRIKTKGKVAFEYGRIEARMRLPQTQGVWPAFWMMGTQNPLWPLCGEVDIMEAVNQCTTVFGTAHRPVKAAEGTESVLGYTTAASGDHTALTEPTDWHLYAIEWDRDTISWYLDDECYASFPIKKNDVFRQPYYLLLNMAVGGSWPGSPEGGSWPQELQVDFVRVYSWE